MRTQPFQVLPEVADKKDKPNFRGRRRDKLERVKKQLSPGRFCMVGHGRQHFFLFAARGTL